MLPSKTMLALLISTTLAWPAWAACPPPPDIAAAQDALLAQAQEAGTAREGQVISNQLWTLWATAPDEPAQELLDTGMRARGSFDFAGAIDAFDRLVAYCPDYAEGYNQRAFVNFLREDFASALVDLDRALDRSPRHVAALSGKALTLMGLGRDAEAQDVLREAVGLNPWIPERGLLKEPPSQEL